MSRVIKTLALTIIAVTIVTITVVYLILRGSLPLLDGEIAVTGLSARVGVERDAAGIPTINASNRNDLAFGIGFVHGQDRFFQMDLSRRKAAGELAELFGSVALPLDRHNRLHRFRSRTSEVIDAMSTTQRALMHAYATGVNAGLASLSVKPFEYYILRNEPKPWTISDSLLVAYAMFLQLNDERAAQDVSRGFARLMLPDALFNWIYPAGTAWDAPLMGEPRPNQVLPTADTIDLRDTHVVFSTDIGEDGAEEMLDGSNNWAVAGELTRSGRAIVANDMHLGMSTPNTFYRARLVQSGDQARDLCGVTLPGIPIVIVGSNGRIAWGFTNSYGDWADAVLLRAGPTPESYRTPDGIKMIATYRERIEVKGAEVEELLVRETVWGPILDDIKHPYGEIAISWIAHYPQAVNITQLELETADTVEDAIAIANRMGIPPQNFVVGDTDGSIAWTIAGRIPRRDDVKALPLADWSKGAGWHGWLAPDEYPRVVNPVSGRIWSANARVTDGADLDKIGDGGYALGARARQIRDALFGRNRFEPAHMLDIQLDDRALFLARWRLLLLELLDESATRGRPARSEYLRLVSGWVPRASADSVGYRLVRSFRTDVRNRTFQMLTQTVRAAFGDAVRLRISNQYEGPLWQLVTERPTHMLSANYTNWREFLLESVDNNILYYKDNFGDGLANRTWGERNIAAIRHPLSRALPILSEWLDMPREQLRGDINMPRVQSPSFGASERFAVSPGDEENGYLHMPAGQSGHPLSDYYRSGHIDWVHGRASQFLPGITRHRLVLLPDA